MSNSFTQLEAEEQGLGEMGFKVAVNDDSMSLEISLVILLQNTMPF